MKTKQNRINRRPGPAFDVARIPWTPRQAHLETTSILLRRSAKLQTDFLQKANMSLKTLAS
jgi:hypothetical protein